MKVALIFYGFFRTFEECKSSLKTNILDILNPDVFISTPSTFYAAKSDEVSEMWKVYSKNEDKILPHHLNIFTNLKSCKLRDYNSELYLTYVANRDIPLHNQVKQYSWRIISTLHSISLSVNLFKDYLEKFNDTYDMVILTRPDVVYHAPFNLKLIDLDKINNPKHHIKRGQLFTGSAPILSMPGHTFNDQLIVSNQNNILKYLNIFDKIEDYYKMGIPLNTETILGVHALKNNIQKTEADFIRHELKR